MVGVASKSKGCTTCRRRKIKVSSILRITMKQKCLIYGQCDLKRPNCARCEKSGKECEGYDRYSVFIRKGIDGWEKRMPLEETKPRQNIPGSNIPNQLRSIAVEGAQFIDHFFRDFVCTSERGIPKQDYIDPSSWARGLEFLKSSETLLHNVLIAVSMVYCAKSRRDEDLLRQGRGWYTRALYQLCKLLGNDQSSYDDQVLVSTSVCMAYETIDPSDPTSSVGWDKHFGGMTELLQHRGPLSFENVRNRDVLEDSRYVLMMSGLIHRKSSFLIQEEWMTEPWKGVNKSIQQQVVDCGLFLGDIFERIDMLPSPVDGPNSVAAEMVITECWSLERFLQRLAAELPDVTQPEDSPGAWSFRAQHCSRGIFELASHLRLQVTIIGIRLNVHDTISALAQRYNLTNYTLEGLPQEQNRKALATSALNLVASYMAMNIASVAKGRHVFALQRAKAQFDTNDAEFERCSRLLYEIQDKQYSSDLANELGKDDDLDTWCMMVTNPPKVMQRSS